MIPLAAVNHFYELIVRLSEKPGQGRSLREVLNGGALPARGVYFFS